MFDDLQIYLHSSFDDLNNNLSLINEDAGAVCNWTKSNHHMTNFNKT